MVWFEIIGLIIAFIVLAKSGSFLVNSLTKIAMFFKLNEFVLAAILMAAATSLPELFVGITASLNKASALVLGNIIGANILDLTLVVGIPILLAKGIKLESKLVKEDAFYTILISVLVLFLMLDRTLSRIDGVILISVFILYLIKNIKHSRRFEKTVNSVTPGQLFNNVAVLIFAFFALLISASFIVKFAISLSNIFQIPQILIGLFLISFGTTMPELSFGINAVLKKHGSMTIGNAFGSVIFNAAMILGLSALIYPITSDFLLFLTSCAFLILVSFTFWTFLESGKKLTWQEGVALLLFYIFFIIVELTIKGII